MTGLALHGKLMRSKYAKLQGVEMVQMFQYFAYNITSFNHPISLDIPTKYIYNLENLTTVVNTLDSLHNYTCMPW